MKSSVSLMHMLQSFLIEIIEHFEAALPGEVEILSRGRTILRGQWHGHEFGVRVCLAKHKDDMWPHVEARLVVDEHDERIEVHPDSTSKAHAQKLIEHLEAKIIHRSASTPES